MSYLPKKRAERGALVQHPPLKGLSTTFFSPIKSAFVFLSGHASPILLPKALQRVGFPCRKCKQDLKSSWLVNLQNPSMVVSKMPHAYRSQASHTYWSCKQHSIISLHVDMCSILNPLPKGNNKVPKGLAWLPKVSQVCTPLFFVMQIIFQIFFHTEKGWLFNKLISDSFNAVTLEFILQFDPGQLFIQVGPNPFKKGCCTSSYAWQKASKIQRSF